MPKIAVLLVFLCALSLYAAEAGDDEEALIAPAPRAQVIVKSVAVRGSDVRVRLSTRAGQLLDPGTISRDVKTLWATGQYSDIRVQTTEEAGGMAVFFEVTEKQKLFLRDMRLEPNSYGMQLMLPPGTPMDELQARRVAGQVRRKLSEKGYVDADVDPELTHVGKNKVDLLLHVKAGDSVRVKDVEISGETAFSKEEVYQALSALRARQILPAIPRIWHGWKVDPAYSYEAVESDLARLQSFYLERGYFDARVAVENTQVEGEDAHVKLFVRAGPHYRVNRIEVSGEGIQPIVQTPVNGLFQPRALCSCLMKARREAEKKGIVDFAARLSLHPTAETTPVTEATAGTEAATGTDTVVDLSAGVEEGRPYKVGRIEFKGAQHYTEATIRRNLLLDEGDILDATVLRKSLAQLNQAQMFEPVDEADVAINTDEKSGTADIIIPLREKKRGIWSFSGPVGPISFAGPLQATIASRLPPWGRGVLELSTYYISFSAIGYFSPIAKVLPLVWSKQGILPVLSLFRPYTAGEGWRSGFLIAPQLGWQASVYTYATTQVTSRLVPIIQGNTYMSQLPVTFERSSGDGVLLCNPPQPRMHTLRLGASVLLQFVASAQGGF